MKANLSGSFSKRIDDRIFILRGQPVILDYDLAELCNVQVPALIKSIQRKRKKFPSGSVFQTSPDEISALALSHFISENAPGRPHLPYALGALALPILSTLLHSEEAVQIYELMIRAAARRHFGTAVNNLAFTLYGQLRTADNLVFSPLGIYCAIGILCQATNPPLSQLSKLLYRDEPTSETDCLGAVLDDLKPFAQLTKLARDFSLEMELQLSIANAMWGQSDHPKNSVSIESESTRVEMRNLNFLAAPNRARKTINDWIVARSGGRLNGAISNLSPTTQAILTGVNCFAFRCGHRFSFACPNDFELLDGRRVKAQMMYGSYLWSPNIVKRENFWSVEILLEGTPLALLFIVPQADCFSAIEENLVGMWNNIIANGFPGSLNLAVPKFVTALNLEITRIMGALGLSDNSGAHVDSILQHAFFAIDRSEVHPTIGWFGSQPKISLSIDRPFLYGVVHKPTGAILFFGRVLKPDG